jgi:aminoglycoside phosphotransferase (APT) family kinase protein
VTTILAGRRTLAELIDEADGRVVCLAMSKDPNAKVTMLLFAPGENRPGYVAKVPTTDVAVRSVQSEAGRLARLGHRDLGPLAQTVPRIVSIAEHRGRPVLVTTALTGQIMLAAYHTWRHTARPAAVRADYRAAGQWLAQLQSRTARGRADLADALGSAAGELARRFAGEQGLSGDLRELAALHGRLAGHQVPQVVVHGDFWPGNLLLDGGQVRGVIDWECSRQDGPPSRDLARFMISYSLYLDRHTRPGRQVAGHPGLRAGRWGAGIEYAVDGTGWYPELARGFVADGLRRLGAPAARWRDVVLAEVACIAAEADHPEFARQHLLLLRRLAAAGGRP